MQRAGCLNWAYWEIAASEKEKERANELLIVIRLYRMGSKHCIDCMYMFGQLLFGYALDILNADSCQRSFKICQILINSCFRQYLRQDFLSFRLLK